MNETDFEGVIALITRETGIIPRESHKAGIRRYVEERLSELQSFEIVNVASFFSQNTDEFSKLIDKATVNETYFFREEKQLDLIKTEIFPALLKKNATLNIWSAACSSGEEIYSLALLARFCSVRADYTASDINSLMIEKCKNGEYSQNSIRSVDGAKYHFLLDPYKQTDGTFKMSAELSGSIITKYINLSDLAGQHLPENLPKNQHIIFIRNVFIYFSRETRAKILKTIATQCLSDDGCLFVSMSEIASIDSEIIPTELERVMTKNVFYFRKKTSKK